MPATLTLMALYNHDNDILSSEVFPLPEGLYHTTLDPLLLAETAELEILYPDPEIMAYVIKAWADARGPAWDRMLAALDATYNPIHNYDRTESWSEGKEAASGRSGSRANQGTHSQQGSSTASVARNVAGYNSSAANVPKGADSSSGTDSNSGTTGNNEQWTEQGTNAETGSRSGHIAGNIGVTKTQEMIQDEIKLRRMDIYQIIVAEFKGRFCLGVY